MTDTLSDVSITAPQTDTIPPRRTRRLFIPCCCGGCALLVLPFLVILLLSAPHAYAIPSAGMEPTLKGEDSPMADRILSSNWDYRFHPPHFGDMVVFLAPKKADAESAYKGVPQKENILVKRIIGLPQDTILLKEARIRWNGHEEIAYAVFRNGVQLDEPYIKEPMETPQPSAIYGVNKPIKLGTDEYFVMGDNRNDSNDSRYWGPLAANRVI